MTQCIRCSKEVEWASVKYKLCTNCYVEVILKDIEVTKEAWEQVYLKSKSDNQNKKSH